MKLGIIPAGIYDANCYILMDADSNEAVVMDPGGDADKLIKAINDMKAEVKAIILTHGHADHTGAVNELKSKYNAPVLINAADEAFISKGEFIFGQIDKADKNIIDGEIVEIGNMKIKCIATPGHTPGGMCFLVENLLFTGDTLFYGSIGRTDFAGGDFDTLINSIKNKLMVLNENTIVYPGHGPKTTIGFEKRENPFL